MAGHTRCSPKMASSPLLPLMLQGALFAAELRQFTLALNGRAHSLLFAAELPQFIKSLPEDLQREMHTFKAQHHADPLLLHLDPRRLDPHTAAHVRLNCFNNSSPTTSST